MKKNYFIKQPIAEILQFISGVAGGVLLTIIISWLYQLFGWSFAGSFNKQVTFLFFSLFTYPVGVWLGIYITGICNKSKHYIWLSLSGMFLGVIIFLLFAVATNDGSRNFYVYWGIHYLLYPILIFLGAHRLFLKKS